jgi:hypothetical protein
VAVAVVAVEVAVAVAAVMVVQIVSEMHHWLVEKRPLDATLKDVV